MCQYLQIPILPLTNPLKIKRIPWYPLTNPLQGDGAFHAVQPQTICAILQRIYPQI